MSLSMHSRPGQARTDLTALVAAHRGLQQEHRAAIATEDPHERDIVERRLAILQGHLRNHHVLLAAALAAETTAGASLLVALTSVGPPGELADAVTAYQRCLDETARHLPRLTRALAGDVLFEEP